MTQALHTLLGHAERQRDQALVTLLQTEQAVRGLRLQSEQLHAYRNEYRHRHPAAGGRSAAIELLRCHEDFMGRLEQALAQQLQQLRAAEAREQALRAELLALELRVASVRKLLERRGADADRHSQRQEQRRSDDAAQRRRNDGSSADWQTSALPATP